MHKKDEGEYPSMNPFSRTEMLLGSANMTKLQNARVAVFGIGGVGSYVVEALARSGVGTLDLIDSDRVAPSNINRQIIATMDTLGQYKVDAAKARILSINPEAAVNTFRTFYLPETAGQFDFTKYDYVVDAIDTVTGKIALVMQADAAGVPIISAMGTGNKLNPAAFQVTDIYQTSVCPLARVMRRELKKRGIEKLKVVYSPEEAMTPLPADTDETEAVTPESGTVTVTPESGTAPVTRRQTPGSTAFVPSVAGLIIAGEVIRDLTA